MSTILSDTLSSAPDLLAPSDQPQPCSEWLRPPGSPEPAVLVVDDDPDIPPLVTAALSPFHLRIDSVPSGTAALDVLQQRTYDLIVLDLMLEDLHGFDVLRHLRAHPRFQRLKVLILTADTRLEALARSFGHGADDFLKKPFDLHELAMRAFRLIRPFGG